MAHRFTFEILLSEVEINIVKEYEINISEICINALVDEIKRKHEIKTNISKLTIERQNEELKEHISYVEGLLKEAYTYLDGIKEAKKHDNSNAINKIIAVWRKSL
jgi:hypothetical protein